MTHVFCDRCGRIILEKPTRLTTSSGPLHDAGQLTLDACKDCGQELLEWLRDGQCQQDNAVIMGRLVGWPHIPGAGRMTLES
jgi:hypothetical protein